MAKAPMRVAVTGAAGQICYSLLFRIANGDMPPLFVIGADGSAELVNYRVQGRYMVVDRLFDTAELRLGSGRNARQVRIIREVPRSRGRA